MKKLGIMLACIVGLCALPLSAGPHFSFSFLFNGAALMPPPMPPRVVERHIYMPPQPCYQQTTVIRNYYNPYMPYQQREVIIQQQPYMPWYPY